MLIAIGNAAPGDPELMAAARRCLDDASPLVRAAAVWAFRRLTPPEVWETERDRRRPTEQESLVLEEWLD